jgi:hypothetical protein
MGSLNPLPNWSDPVVLVAIERAFDVTWPVIRAHEAGNDKARIAELSSSIRDAAADVIFCGQRTRLPYPLLQEGLGADALSAPRSSPSSV